MASVLLSELSGDEDDVASRLQAIARLLRAAVARFFEGAPGDVPGAKSGGVRLNAAFARTKNTLLRRQLVDLVTAIAGADGAPD